jgi:sterol desaturase/sphingolipid hydroxylase (fatty acid hydroxylase superfamily)
VISNPITYHCLHHARFLGHYGFATSWADELFGTQFDDWMAATVRVRGGEPLHSLRERVGGDAAEGGGS